MALVEVTTPTTARITPTARSDTATLQAIFPATPYLPGGYQGQYDNEQVATAHQLLTDGTQTENPDFAGGIDLDYAGRATPDGAPDLSAVAVGPGGLPGSPYAPNTVSPGPGNGLNPSAQVDPPPNHPRVGGSGENGSLRSPHETSAQIAAQRETDQAPASSPQNFTFGDSGVTPGTLPP